MKQFATKIQKSSQAVTAFAGISYVNNTFNQVGLAQLIDTEFGVRTLSGYQYSEIIRNLYNIYFCGGECAEDIQVHLRKDLSEIPGNRPPSPDTILGSIKELAAENTPYVSSKGQSYNFNINDKLNDLNLKSLLLTGQLGSGQSYDFDYDNQIIAHDKYDARHTYKKTKGYFPGVATIGDKIVYIENRDGNANVKTGQAETLSRAYESLKRHGISIKRSRMDAGSYSQNIVEVVASQSELFYIRANKCESLLERIRDVSDWKKVEINYINYEVCSLEFTQFHADKHYRLVVMREKSNDPQLNVFTGDNLRYRCILTNDHIQAEKDIIEYYNQRGSSEKTFDIQNNDFGWSRLPCSFMDANTAYLILMAMCKNFYNYLISQVSQVFKDIPLQSRLKRFIYRFICVPGKWMRQSRRWILKLYTNRPYEKLY